VKKKKIELMIPDDVLNDYLARINISESHVAKLFEWSGDINWEGIDILLIEGQPYAKILDFVITVPDELKVIVIENKNEQYLYKAQLDRHGIEFVTRQSFLERFEIETQEEKPVVDPSLKLKEKKAKRKQRLAGVASFLNLRAKAFRIIKKIKESLLSKKKATVRKIDLEPIKKESPIAITKKIDGVKKVNTTGTFALSGSAFICFLLAEYLSKFGPVAVLDFTGDLNSYYGCNETGRIQDLIEERDDPFVISDKLYYYADQIKTIDAESFLRIREQLLINVKAIIVYLPGELIEGISPVVDKIFLTVSEENIIKSRAADTQISNNSKLKLVINKRLNILSRRDVRKT